MPQASALPVRTRLIGTTPYAQHNVQLADPDNDWARAISKVTAKRKKTEEDRQEIKRLEFFGGLYVADGRVVVPKANVRRAFQEAAKATRKGRDIVRALNNADPGSPNAVLAFPDDQVPPDELYGEKLRDKYAEMTIVAIRGRTPRCRPTFPSWGLTVDWLLLTNLLDYEEFKEIAELSGIIEGLGDNRVNGYGRFTCEVSRIEPERPTKAHK
jgi:hypothetical protein